VCHLRPAIAGPDRAAAQAARCPRRGGASSTAAPRSRGHRSRPATAGRAPLSGPLVGFAAGPPRFRRARVRPSSRRSAPRSAFVAAPRSAVGVRRSTQCAAPRRRPRRASMARQADSSSGRSIPISVPVRIPQAARRLSPRRVPGRLRAGGRPGALVVMASTGTSSARRSSLMCSHLRSRAPSATGLSARSTSSSTGVRSAPGSA